MIDSLGDPDSLRCARATSSLPTRAAALEWRADTDEQWLALKRFTDREGLRIAAHDVLDLVEAETRWKAR